MDIQNSRFSCNCLWLSPPSSQNKMMNRNTTFDLHLRIVWDRNNGWYVFYYQYSLNKLIWLPRLNCLYVLLLLSECQNYQSLTSAYRNVKYTYHSISCDRSLGPAWFRFQGAAGTRMPTSCPPSRRCNTDATGWLNGIHPTVADGRVTRQVCFHWFSNCCNWSRNIEVRNCGSFYVYYLNGTPACYLRYCGAD